MIEGCRVAQPNTQYCLACDIDNLYFLAKGVCNRCAVKSCAKIDATGNCIECEHGFYLRQGSVCMKVTMIPGCMKYSTSAPTTVCLECNTSSVQINGICLPRIANCLAYIPGTNLCAQCADKFTQSPDWSTCVPGTISFCLQFDCLGLCVRCDEDFPRLSINRNFCLPTIDYCLTHVNDRHECKTCFSGYHLTNSKKGCVPNIQFCAAYSPQTDVTEVVYCSQCLNNYQLSPDRRECWSLILNCRTFVTLTKTCLQCLPGFMPTDDNKACLSMIPNCLVYQQSTALSQRHKCHVCRDTFAPTNNWSACVPFCPDGTRLCPSLNRCVSTPFCCLADDGCGKCTSVKPGYVVCPLYDTCAPIPSECPTSHDNCGNCVCQSPEVRCAKTGRCVDPTCPSNSQKFNPETCRCECPSVCSPLHSLDVDCNCKCVVTPQCVGFQFFNPDRCSCECQGSRQCSCGHVWSPVLCDCIPDSGAKCDSPLHLFDANVCACVCRTQQQCLCGSRPVNATCGCTALPSGGPNQVFDVGICQLRCVSPQQCSCGFYWDSQTCNCVVDPTAKCLSPLHTFDLNTCACVCLRQQQCQCGTSPLNSTCGCTPYDTCQSPQVFNATACVCECPFVQQCGCGFTFSHSTCSCQADPAVKCDSALHFFNTATCDCECLRPEVCRCGVASINATCSCAAQPSCSYPQQWDVSTCSCKCPSIPQCRCGFAFNPTTCECDTNLPASSLCSDSAKYRFDSATCQCACRDQVQCPCGGVQLNSTCACPPTPVCPPSSTYDQERCQCRVSIPDCGCGKTFSAESQSCVPNPTVLCSSPFHSFDFDTCECVCRSQPTCKCGTLPLNSTCTCSALPSCVEGFYFDDGECRCKCKTDVVCGCGRVLDVDACRCVHDPKATCESALHRFDYDSCDCVCSSPPASCPCSTTLTNSTCACSALPGPKDGRVFDVSLCQYVCEEVSCGCGRKYDYSTCSCVHDPLFACSPLHKYDYGLCQCVCNSQQACLCGTTALPDTCGCSAYPVCEGAQRFNTEKCACECPDGVQTCPCGQYWCTKCCRCKADPVFTCPALQTFSTSTCTCECAIKMECPCGSSFKTDTCECSQRTPPPCSSMVYSCVNLRWENPSKPPYVPSCHVFSTTTCDFVPPTCSTDRSVLYFGSQESPQCQCGSPIENCKFYATNTIPALSSMFPFVCAICDFGYKVASIPTRCSVNELFTISLFSDQFGVVPAQSGTFKGHLVGKKDTRSFALASQSWASVSAAFVTQWVIKRYFENGVAFFTFSQEMPTNDPLLSPFVYLCKVQNSPGNILTVSGYQIRPFTLTKPAFDIMFRIELLPNAHTMTYFIGTVKDYSGLTYIDSGFNLVLGVPMGEAFRFYHAGYYMN